MVDFRLYLISDRQQVRSGDLFEALGAAADAGIRAIQLREKDLPACQVYELACRLVGRLASCGTRLLINDRADITAAAGAHGVHLPASGLSPRDVRATFPSLPLVGASAHSLEEARRAADEGADFITVGPVYETPSKLPYGPPLGVSALADIVQGVTVPVFAIGGITPDRVGLCLEAGAHGVAVISAILAANVPEAVAVFAQALDGL